MPVWTREFTRASDIILQHEGGFQKSPDDPGNWTGYGRGNGVLKGTKYGISAAQYPNLDIENLTKDDARLIYFSDYWRKVRGDRLPFGIALVLFDFYVTSSPAAVIKSLQDAVSVKQDGLFGDRTLAAVFTHNQRYVIEQLTTNRILYYTGLKNFPQNKGGWIRRSIETMGHALADTGESR